MKKIKYLLLFLFIFPVIVKGDMAAPMSNYKVRVTNSEGAYLYEYNYEKKGYVKKDSKIEFDTIVKIDYEMTIDNQPFGGYVCADEERKECGYIKLSDTTTVDINLDDFYKEAKQSFYVFDDTCYLYDGPSALVYNKLDPEEKLEVGYTFSSNYYDDMWVYVPEKKAWVYKYTYTKVPGKLDPAGMLLTSLDYKYNLMTMMEVKIYDNPKTKANVLLTIPAGTKITTHYAYVMQPHSPFYYVTYNGVSGFIESVGEDDVITNIAYEIENQKIKVVKEGGINFYKTNAKTDVIDTIPSGTDLRPKYALYGSHEVWMYQVEYNNQVGWIDGTYTNFESSYEEIIPEEIVTDLVEEEDGQEQEEEVIYDDDSDEVSVRKTIIISVIAVIIISLTALVTVLLINKKKAKKENKDVDTDTDMDDIN